MLVSFSWLQALSFYFCWKMIYYSYMYRGNCVCDFHRRWAFSSWNKLSLLPLKTLICSEREFISIWRLDGPIYLANLCAASIIEICSDASRDPSECNLRHNRLVFEGSCNKIQLQFLEYMKQFCYVLWNTAADQTTRITSCYYTVLSHPSIILYNTVLLLYCI